jgi:hypothetical protein
MSTGTRYLEGAALTNTNTTREFLGRLAPVRILAIVDNMVRTQLLQLLPLGGGAGRGNDLRAGRLGKLDAKDADAAGALREDPLAGLERAALEAVQRVPRRQGRDRQRAALAQVQVRRQAHDARLGEDAVLLQRAVDDPTHARLHRARRQRAALMRLVEQHRHSVARLEVGHGRADRLDGAGAVRGRHHAVALGQGVETLRDGEIAVVERDMVD